MTSSPPPLWPCLAVVGGQVATLAVTWPLWNARDDALPLTAWPAFDVGWLLLGSCVAVLRWPVAATLAHWLLLAFAIVVDQTREQPQVLSLALLLLIAWPGEAAKRVATLHLAALWLFAGLGKLTSVRFLTIGGTWIVGGAAGIDEPGGATGIAAAVVVGVYELLLGIAVLAPRWRRRAGCCGTLLHLGILTLLSPLVRDWNVAVWPWNATLAVVALSVPGRVDRLLVGAVPRAVAAAFVLLAIGFHCGLVDGPLAMQVYTQNGARGVVVRADGPTELPEADPALRVALPPVARILRVWFRRHAGPSDRMLLCDDRPLAGVWGPREVVVGAEEH